MSNQSKHTAVIGAGLGGLAAAALFARQGYRVTVFEKNTTPGGKMQEIRSGKYRFDTGPSLLTLPFILEKLFQSCGQNLSGFLELVRPEPLCRYFYPDDKRFDSFSNPDDALREVGKVFPEDLENYQNFLHYSEDLYRRISEAYLMNPLYDLSDLRHLRITDFARIDAFTTVAGRINRSFTTPHLQQFFQRFSTYTGSSPWQVPATLNVIPHVELTLGGYYVKGGLYKIAKSLFQLAKGLGVSFRFQQEVVSLVVSDRDKTISGLNLSDGTTVPADLVVANSDATDTVVNLLPGDALPERTKTRFASVEPSCSGFIMMLGCKAEWNQLRHHNIFFSSSYEKEFRDIFRRKRLPENPTIYVANTSFTDRNDAPEGSSNLFVLVNAPYMDQSHDWKSLKKQYGGFIIRELEKRGLTRLEQSIEFRKTLTPLDFFKRYGSNKGSIYGTSSNGRMAAFMRPRNKFKGIRNLYMVGGSTHPGGGIPLVIQSAFNAAELTGR